MNDRHRVGQPLLYVTAYPVNRAPTSFKNASSQEACAISLEYSTNRSFNHVAALPQRTVRFCWTKKYILKHENTCCVHTIMPDTI